MNYKLLFLTIGIFSSINLFAQQHGNEMGAQTDNDRHGGWAWQSTDFAGAIRKRKSMFKPALLGRLFEEGTVGRAGIALERVFNVTGERPPQFNS